LPALTLKSTQRIHIKDRQSLSLNVSLKYSFDRLTQITQQDIFAYKDFKDPLFSSTSNRTNGEPLKKERLAESSKKLCDDYRTSLIQAQAMAGHSDLKDDYDLFLQP
jgi:hypothetical protein